MNRITYRYLHRERKVSQTALPIILAPLASVAIIIAMFFMVGGRGAAMGIPVELPASNGHAIDPARSSVVTIDADERFIERC